MRRLIVLLALLLAACAPRASLTSARTVVTLGDSVPAGTACGCEPFPSLYADAQHAISVNLASPGSTSADVRAAVPADRDVLSSATEVIIMTGANDMASSVGRPSRYASGAAAIRSNVADAVTAVERIHRMPVIVLGYWNVVLDGQVGAAQYGPSGVRDAAAATAAVNEALRAAAARAGATYVSTSTAFHGDDGSHDPTGLLAPDGDHPNAAGHAAIAALLPPLSSGRSE
ncbi:SGNH/GDSL hydrolase family protein [Actinoplanes sp. NPDC051513]|uniref:SGNH/GDSL hydrolase family protein n=1 Tax=Actinoplanes sp. NPDC051513 TaxID=3363908 RepID=UPI0037973F78